MKEVPMNDTEASIDAYYDEQTRYEERTGYFVALRALRQAEDEMIEWARQVMIHEYPTRYEQVRPAFDQGPQNLMIRVKLVDICARLKA